MSQTIHKSCKQCGDAFTIKPPRNAQRYCHKPKMKKCLKCNNEFMFICSFKILKYCSTECKENGNFKPQKHCTKCGYIFTGRNDRQKRCAKCCKQYFLKCHSCKNDFVSHSPKSIYCLQFKSKKCHVCMKNYQYPCGNDKRFKTCGKTKCIIESRKQKRKNTQYFCPYCDQSFYGGRTGKACGQTKIINCKSCSKSVSVRCSKNMKSFCNSACALQYRFDTRNIYFERQCLICEQTFATHLGGQKYCQITHEAPCEFCLTMIETKNQNIINNRKVFCQKYCRDLYSLNIMENRKQYVQLLKEHKQGKSISQIQHDFPSLNFTKRLQNFIYQGITPSLEDIVFDYCRIVLPKTIIQRNMRIIKGKHSNSRLEIDLFIPSLNIGFEVQDFWTHSRESDNEQFEYGLKRGPSHHRMKRELAMKQLKVKIVDLWEDDIRSHRFKEIMDQEIQIEQSLIKSNNT